MKITSEQVVGIIHRALNGFDNPMVNDVTTEKDERGNTQIILTTDNGEDENPKQIFVIDANGVRDISDE